MAHHDLVVIGGGPAGYAAALYGAGAGLDVGLIERHKLGGTCLNVGCIPAKELLETAAVFRTIGHAAMFGITTSEPVVDFTVSQVRKQKIIDTLVGGLGSLLKGRKVTVYDGNGSLQPDKSVQVRGGESGDVDLTGDNILLATGSSPRTLPGFDVDGTIVMTSDEFLSLDRIPESAAIIGGGAIGCEFASMLVDMGSKVTLLEYAPRLIAGADADCSKVVERSFAKRGMTVKTGVAVTGHAPKADGGTVVSFGAGETVEAEIVVMSVGRAPVTHGLGLAATNVQVDDRGFIVIDEDMRTGEPGVFAAGDVPAPAINYDTVPWCIYSHPEVAFAGMTEEEAKEAGFDIVVDKHRYAGNGRAMIVGDTEGLVKVIAEKNAAGHGGRILGVHMVGPWVTEQLGQGYLAVNWEATVDEVAAFIQPHPTISETFGETILALTGRGLH
ncbi:Dihydrolipoyl dehydrogenase [Nymphon striatum]|nr:Dihydrolipoyl dehydrogenase [Nymphon striatum]